MKRISFFFILILFCYVSGAQIMQKGPQTKRITNSENSEPKAYVTTLQWCTNNIDDGIGVNGPATLFGAAQFIAGDLNPYAGNYITEIHIGIDGNAGLISSGKIFIIENPTSSPNKVREQTVSFSSGWNEFFLISPYQISTTPIFIGYEIEVTGGFPMGVSNVGTSKGDWIKINEEAWTHLSVFDLDYNNSIRAVVDTDGTLNNPIANLSSQSYNAGGVFIGENIVSQTFILSNQGAGTLTINNVSTLSMPWSTNFEAGAVSLNPGETYEFNFTFAPSGTGSFNPIFAINTNGGNFNINLYGTGLQPLTGNMDGGFEYNVNDFDMTFDGWIQHDNDGSATYGFTDINFLNSGYTGSFIAFNPAQTDPPMTDAAIQPRTGNRFGACFASTNAVNNDWLITPQSDVIYQGAIFRMWVKSYIADYGLERFTVNVSTTGTAAANFTKISPGAYLQAPAEAWTLVEYSLDAFIGQQIYVGIQCVSNDAFIFMVDDIEIFNPGPVVMDGGFENNVADFSLVFPGRAQYDIDGSGTYGINGVSFPNSNYTGSFIAFNPSATTPSQSTNINLTPHTGNRFGACFAATESANNDWLISPQSDILNPGAIFRMWVKSFIADYGLERYTVNISTSGITISDFTKISTGNYVQAPTTWTLVEYPLDAYVGQQIYAGIQCVSDDAFIFMLDDIEIYNPVICPENMVFCIDDDETELAGALPIGGVYSGNGVINGIFFPTIAGEGIHEILYAYNDQTCTFEITVNMLPAISCPDNNIFCANDPEFEIIDVNPQGGSFDGSSVDINIFNPFNAAIGENIITYNYTDPLTNCTNTCSFIFSVNPSPEVICQDEIIVCEDFPEFELVGTIPEGGIFSGPGVDEEMFNPQNANIGENIINYIYTDTETNCTSECNFLIIVNNLPTITCSENIIVCIDDNPFELNTSIPAGGSYSGDGISDGMFYPENAQLGENLITYIYTNPITNCTNICEFFIIVNELPLVSCTEEFAVCIDSPEFELSGSLPEGGVYLGSGVFDNIFNPMIAEIGQNFIQYSYTDPLTNCTNNCEFVVIVNPLPSVICPDDFSVCIDSDEFELNNANPLGGSHSGMGVSNGFFNPAIANLGINTITYTYTDQLTECTNQCVYSITVNNLPEMECSDDLILCINSEALILQNSSPEGGIYSGLGVAEGLFYPEVAGLGECLISYTFTNIETQCTNSCSFNIYVIDIPELVCPNNLEICEDIPDFELTGGLPLGGEYSGNGVSNNYFYPSTANPGLNLISYTYLDIETNCDNTCEFEIIVNSLPEVICPSNQSVCVYNPPFTLSGQNPSGGLFNGTGVSNGNFNPSIAQIGNNIITYFYIDPITECSNSCEFVITVNDFPTIMCPQDIYIETGSPAFSLSGAMPEGGLYYINNMITYSFDPSLNVPGAYTVVYMYSDPMTNCSNVCSFIIYLFDPDIAVCPEEFIICKNANPINLQGALPPGGTYSLQGVDITEFNPELYELGEHIISYNIDEMECSFIIEIIEIPELVCPDNLVNCVSDAEFILSGGTPINGVYYGSGVIDAIFYPSISVLGDNIISYTYTDPITECSNSCEFIITVNPLPELICPEFENVCSDSPDIILDGAIPAGGFYSGNNVIDNVFNPSTALIGENIVYYTYYDQLTECENSCTSIIYVNPQPEVICPQNLNSCIDTPEFELFGATPIEGEYSGDYVSDGFFNPDIANIGIHSITYTYFNPITNCSNSCEFEITVSDLPNVLCPQDMNICEDYQEFMLTGALPSGGVYSGEAVLFGIFKPDLAQTGENIVYYTLSDIQTGCSNICEFIINMNEIPEVNCPDDDILVSINTPEFFIDGASPEGGTYYYNDLQISIFNPSLIGVGVHEIFYYYSDGNDCENHCSFNIEVAVIPGTETNMINRISVFPNPNNGVFTIDYQGLGDFIMEITDVKASLIYSEYIKDDSNSKTINLNVLPGIYFVKIIGKQNVLIEKIIIN